MKRCPKCGKYYGNAAPTCPKCGVILQNNDYKTNHTVFTTTNQNITNAHEKLKNASLIYCIFMSIIGGILTLVGFLGTVMFEQPLLLLLILVGVIIVAVGWTNALIMYNLAEINENTKKLNENTKNGLKAVGSATNELPEL